MYQEKIKRFFSEKLASWVAAEKLPPEFLSLPLEVEKPTALGFGDYFSNFCLSGAKILKMPPRKVAEMIFPIFDPLPDFLESVELAGPGFLNFNLGMKGLGKALLDILEQKEAYGRCSLGHNLKTQVEFVSVNPVGPLHVGHGRWAAVGDSVANLLKAAGYNVETEFYVNDCGNQMQLFKQSVYARFKQINEPDYPFPEDGYHGGYVKELAQEIAKTLPPDAELETVGELGYEKILAQLKGTLVNIGAAFDLWFSERKLHRDNKAAEALAILEKNSATYQSEGALWFASTKYGDNRDSVLIRSNGQPTYFMNDIAYHLDKLQRGFQWIINLWGADHGGHVPRMHAAFEALGYRGDQLKVMLGQMVNLKKAGEPVRMSKRTGEMITLQELLDEVGKDAARFIFLSKNLNTTLDFDLEVAVKKNLENPVYYIQYAHARICSIFRMAGQQGIAQAEPSFALIEKLSGEDDLKILQKLESYPSMLADSAKTLSPHHLAYYLTELASDLHHFYRFTRVLGYNDPGVSEGDLGPSEPASPAVTQARLLLLSGVKQVMENCCGILGISLPERM